MAGRALTRQKINKINEAIAVLASAWAYLLNTREHRDKGNKEKPESIVYQAMMDVIKE